MTQIDLAKLAQDCLDAIQGEIKGLKKLNVIIAGKTGVGKSTLINAMFRENLAETGIGRPVTEHMKRLTKPDFPLAIYDTRGFELSGKVQKQVTQEIIDTIEDGAKSKDQEDDIHCLWYCVSGASDRLEPEEISFIEKLTEGTRRARVPVIIVLTKSVSKASVKKLRDYILDQNLDVVQVVPVLAQDYPIDEDYTVKAYGLDTLLSVMIASLPDELQKTLQFVQKASLKAKIDAAQKVVAGFVTAAAGEGAVPVPFADAAMLIPTQVSMIAGITVVFGIDVSRSVILGFVSSALGSSAATIGGRTITSNLLKLIPGAGSVAGGAISAATAGLLTAAIGEAYIQIMIAVYKGELKEEDLKTETGKRKFEEIVTTAIANPSLAT